jgi:hypothetical protein
VTDIDADIMAAEADQRRARDSETRAIRLRDGARVSIEAKKREIAEAKRRRELARSSGAEAETSALDLARRAGEREQELLERRAELREAEIDLAKHSGELATLLKRALDFERELALKRIERAAIKEPGAAASTLDRVVFDIERQTLEARRRQAEKKIDVASREKRVVDRLLKILEARRDVR